MLKLKELDILGSIKELGFLPEGKVLINTINAHSYNTAQKDELFAEALATKSRNGSLELTKDERRKTKDINKYLIPDGASIVKACKWLKAKSQPKERIAGWDLFTFEMQRLNDKRPSKSPCLGGLSATLDDKTDDSISHSLSREGWSGSPLRVMFMGSSEKVLGLIRERAAKEYPNLEVVTYSPPYKAEFSDEENRKIIEAINKANPDLLWIGMTAPKQEKWTYSHWEELDIHCHVGTIGAVFDFFAGTAQRAPKWWQEHSLEWLYRLLKEPKRMWKRYVIGNPLFVYNIIKEIICR